METLNGMVNGVMDHNKYKNIKNKYNK